MRIIVPIKQVPETSSVKMDEETGTMIREGVEAIVNPLDLYAIESALRLREAHGGEVVTISMGPPTDDKALREAVAMGCDAAVLLSNRAFAGADTWATSYVLSAGIRKLGAFDLVICGERATDGDTGQVGPGIAGFLELPVLTYIGKVVEAANGTLRAHRLVENGHEDLEVELPAVLTVVKEVGEARLPTLRGKRRARDVDLPVWGPDDLEVDLEQLGLKGSPTRVVKIFRPKVARECVKMTASDDATTEKAVDGLVTFLQKQELL